MKSIAIVYITLCCSLLSINNVMAADINRLKDHPSPYLAMHGQDPVHWQSWGKDIFERARKENKLVFVSIGYFACHWCHVMQRESYQNTDIASFINKNFIAVKVDRELQPALDARLIEFVERTRGYAGWPLNVFITPAGYPLLGIVYLPPKDFKDLLVNMHQAWAEDAAGMNVMAEAAAESMQRSDRSEGVKLNKQQIKNYQASYVSDALKNADHFQGGFGEQSKFPLFPQLAFLLELYKKDKDKSLGEFLHLTLDKMARTGMYDQLRGGFYRYVVDPDWLIPHFEKMLYDNALLAVLYQEAARIFDEPQYQVIAEQTLDFMLSELLDGSGGMISSLSAIDSNNVEGGYYLWPTEELQKNLSADEYTIMTLHWGMQHSPALEGGHHPRVAMDVEAVSREVKKTSKKVEALIASAKKKLLKRQLQRQLPRDGKLLASWNGLALYALTRAASVNKKYIQHARRLQQFLLSRLWDGKQLKRALADGHYLGDATLEDYAYVAMGLLEWARYTGQASDLDQLEAILMQAWQRFYNEQGWLLAENMIAGINSREAVVSDGPMPSASASLIRVTLEFATKTDNKAMLKLAKMAVNRGHAVLKTDNFWYATHIRAMLESVSAK